MKDCPKPAPEFVAPKKGSESCGKSGPATLLRASTPQCRRKTSKERRNEMREYYYDRRIVDDSIRRLTQPVDAQLRRLAEDIMHLVA
ncbi:hypothetical protein IW152_006124, partial [Coemansia sp. BCRC 34962]